MGLHRRLLENVADAFIGGRQTLRFGQCAESPHGFHARQHLVHARGVLSHHRFDFVRGEFALSQITSQTIEGEGMDILHHAIGQHARRKLASRHLQQFHEIQGQRLLHQNAQNAQCLAAQPEGIPVARGLHADAENSNQGIQLIRQCHGATEVIPR